MTWVDLHVHSIYSNDADWKPGALVETLARLGAAGMSLTDHETLLGLPEARTAAEACGLAFLPGVEIAVQTDHREFHLLVYLTDPMHSVLQAVLEEARELRWSKTRKRVEGLKRLGYVVDLEELGYGEGRLPPMGPHLARRILARSENLERYMNAPHKHWDPQLPIEVNFYREVLRPLTEGDRLPRALPLDLALPRLRQCGAVVLAHPGAGTFYVPDPWIERLAHGGLDGIEVYSTYHDQKERERALYFARKLDLIVTGGSDFHGAIKPRVQLGSTRRVPLETLYLLQARAAERGRAG